MTNEEKLQLMLNSIEKFLNIYDLQKYVDYMLHEGWDENCRITKEDIRKFHGGYLVANTVGFSDNDEDE